MCRARIFRRIPAVLRQPMGPAGRDVVIWGLTRTGRPFRPSDWAERLAGLTSAFGHDQKLAYSPHVRPLTVRGVKAVIVGHELHSLEPRLYQFLVNFARDNDLLTSFELDARSAPQALSLPTPAAASASRAGEPAEPV